MHLAAKKADYKENKNLLKKTKNLLQKKVSTDILYFNL